MIEKRLQSNPTTSNIMEVSKHKKLFESPVSTVTAKLSTKESHLRKYIQKKRKINIESNVKSLETVRLGTRT